MEHSCGRKADDTGVSVDRGPSPERRSLRAIPSRFKARRSRVLPSRRFEADSPSRNFFLGGKVPLDQRLFKSVTICLERRKRDGSGVRPDAAAAKQNSNRVVAAVPFVSVKIGSPTRLLLILVPTLFAVVWMYYRTTPVVFGKRVGFFWRGRPSEAMPGGPGGAEHLYRTFGPPRLSPTPLRAVTPRRSLAPSSCGARQN